MRSALRRVRWSAVTAWCGRHEHTLPWWPPARLAALRDRRLRAMVRHAYTTVPHYRETMRAHGLAPADIATAADLAKLPLVDDRELAEAPERFLSSRYAGRDTLLLTTTGTSGHYKEIHHDPAAVCAALAGGARMRAVVVALAGHGGRLRELAIAPPQGTLVAVREYHRTHLLAALADHAPVDVVSLDQPVAVLIAQINARAPEVVGSFGRMIGRVFREAHARGLPIHRPCLVRYGGEPIAEADRRLIEEHYGVPVLSSYQSCEFLRIAHQCERRSGFHLYTDQVVVRTVDDAGRDVAPGEPGEAVVSSLVNRATVLLNYRLRDRLVLGAAPCPCGRTTPVIAAIDGRSDDMLVAADGEAVHESIVLRRLYGVPGLVRIAVTQFAVDRVEAKVVVAHGAERAAIAVAIRGALAHLLRHADARGIAVEVVADLPAGPGGKFRALVSHCHDQSVSMTSIAARA